MQQHYNNICRTKVLCCPLNFSVKVFYCGMLISTQTLHGVKALRQSGSQPCITSTFCSTLLSRLFTAVLRLLQVKLAKKDRFPCITETGAAYPFIKKKILNATAAQNMKVCRHPALVHTLFWHFVLPTLRSFLEYANPISPNECCTSSFIFAFNGCPHVPHQWHAMLTRITGPPLFIHFQSTTKCECCS